jgi:hypothetical protein
MLRMWHSCSYCLVGCACACVGLAAHLEWHDFRHSEVTLFTCEKPPDPPDLGRAADCDEAPSPHNRPARFTSLALSTGTLGTNQLAFQHAPLVAISITEDEYVGPAADQRFPTVTLHSSNPVLELTPSPKFFLHDGILYQARAAPSADEKDS